MKPTVPRTLRFQNENYLYAGLGRTPGSVLFFSGATGRTLEVHAARIQRTGQYYALAGVPGNPSMPLVRVDWPVIGVPVRVGDNVLISELRFLAAGPRANAAWPVGNGRSHHPEPSQPVRSIGVVAEVCGGGAYGWIHDPRGRRVFVHRAALRGVAQLAVGVRLSFVQVDRGRGPAAEDAWAVLTS